jgi:hypothetical protein
MAKMDQDKTKEIIRNLFDYQKNLTQQILQRIWFRNILYYMGEQWFEWAKSEAVFKRMMPSPYIPTPSLTWCAMLCAHRANSADLINKDFMSPPNNISYELSQLRGFDIGQFIKFLFQSLFADGANLVNRNFNIFVRAFNLKAGSP